MSDNTYAGFPVVTGDVVTEGHAKYCAEHGHATHTVDGVASIFCPRCGDRLQEELSSAADLRRRALRRGNIRTYILFMLEDEAPNFDVDSLITELDGMDDSDYESMGVEQFWSIARRHEYDARGLTDAALVQAIRNGHTGWVATIRRPDGQIQVLSLNKTRDDDTPETVEARLREFVNFPAGTSMMILPLVG